MIFYTPSSRAAKLTAQLWKLSDPNPTRGTTALFPVVVMTDGTTWLMVDTNCNIPVDAGAELNGIADILQPWIEEGYLPADTNEVLASYVESKRGQRLVVYEAFPALFKLADASNPNGNGRTKDQLIAAGIFPQPVLP